MKPERVYPISETIFNMNFCTKKHRITILLENNGTGYNYQWLLFRQHICDIREHKFCMSKTHSTL